MKKFLLLTIAICVFLLPLSVTASEKIPISDLVTVKFIFKDINGLTLERAKFIPPFQIEEGEVAGKVLKCPIPPGAERVDIIIDKSVKKIILDDLERENPFYIISIRGNISGIVYIDNDSLVIQPW